MTQLDRTQQIYRTYLIQAEELESKKRPFEGIFGLNRSPEDPCHDQFIRNLQGLMEEFRAEGIDSGALREVLAYIYSIPQEHQMPVNLYWMLIAAQSVTPDMIPLLAREDAAAVLEQFQRTYKRRVQLPVQKKIVKALEKAAR